MKILVINSGSSSLKFQVIDSETERRYIPYWIRCRTRIKA